MWNSRLVTVLALAVGLGALTSCGDSDESSGPPEIVEGRTICDECGMIIDEIRFAAAYRTADGVERRFDDIGGMLAQGHRDGLLADSEIWVHDFDSHAPIAAPDATFVLSGQVTTPMAWGVIAFESADAARELVDKVEGSVVTWTELVERSAGDDLDPEALHRDHEGHDMDEIEDVDDMNDMNAEQGEG